MQFNQILQPRFSSLLTRYFAIRGAGSPAPTLAPEIAPSFDVNQMDDPAAFFTRNEKLAHSSSTTIAASVGNYSRALLRNPVGSGMVAIVDEILCNTAVSAAAILTATTVDDATAVVGYLRDYRWIQSTGVVSPSCISSSSNASPVLPNTGNGRVMMIAGSTTTWVPVRIIVPPGGALYLVALVVNTALTNSGFNWRERQLPNEETANG